MSKLKRTDQLAFERLLGMETGYVYGFSDRTFGDFVLESTGVDVYSPGYDSRGTSKANRLRRFWDVESDGLTAKLLGDLLEYYKREKELSSDGLDEQDIKRLQICKEVLANFRGSLELSDPTEFTDSTEDPQLQILAASIRECIEKESPNQALDRLHTFVTRWLRALCSRHSIAYDLGESLGKLFTKYCEFLETQGIVESEMSKRTFRSSGSLLDAFNNVRNTQSLAHDNPILNNRESTFLFNVVTSILRFIQSTEDQVRSARDVKRIEEVSWGDIEYSEEEIDAAGENWMQSKLDIARGK